MSAGGWIGVDLDGTLATYESGQWPEIGAPIPAMVERVKGWLVDGLEVKIVTARLSGDLRGAEEQVHRITDWCVKVFGVALEVTCVKDYSMVELWDDRAVGVVKNTGETVEDATARKIAEWLESEYGHSRFDTGGLFEVTAELRSGAWK